MNRPVDRRHVVGTLGIAGGTAVLRFRARAARIAGRRSRWPTDQVVGRGRAHLRSAKALPADSGSAGAA